MTRPAPQQTSSQRKIRVLFLAEAVTLAHVARPLSLAGSLDASRYDIHFAHCPRYADLVGDQHFTEHAIHSIAPVEFAAALAAGRPLYDLETLKGYVEQERTLLDELRPDVIVADFRITAAVSAELAGIPSVCIANTCWSPYVDQRYTVPDLPLVRRFGVTVAQGLFSIGRPVAFAMHSRPMAALRRVHGLPPLGADLNRVYTHADYTLYADIPGLYKTAELPSNHREIGPVLWSPAAPLPSWWHTVDTSRPLVYVTPGSSGRADLLPAMIAALGELEVTAMVASAGMELQSPLPANVHAAAFLPGDLAARRSSLVVCNGGSPTTHQALSEGAAVLGLPTNLDQFLNLATLCNAGVAGMMRADQFQRGAFQSQVMAMLADDSLSAAAASMAQRIQQCSAANHFPQFMDDPQSPWWRSAQSD
ncbi:MAG: glycosyl transferase family 1 [Gammaproteobacteria bacterium]|nr:glycosyl transferase family 1 [Gammaproteobacteria bacterium]